MRSKFNVVLIAIVLAGAVFGVIVGDRVLAKDSDEKLAMEQFAELLAVVESSYPEEVDAEKVVFSAIRGMLRTLDPHSNFLDPKTYRSMREEQRGHFSGLGIVVTKKGDRLTVISPIEDTPAYRLGIRAGDVIARIESEPTNEMTLDDAVGRLKGAKGTHVTVTIDRIGTEPFDLTITRDDIPTKSVSRSFLVEPSVGYLRIKNFTQTTHDEVVAAIDSLDEQGMKSLILDLRSNPGGLLDQAVKVGDLFVGRGQTIVYTRGRLPESNQSFAARNEEHGDYPLIVLVDHGSASASEIVAGAIQDHDRGLIVGETTWGKGLVQSVYSLRYNAGLALTTAKYFTPSGRCIQRDYSSSFEDYYEFDPSEPQERDASELVRTDSGRTVYGGGGIAPDVEVESPELTEREQEFERKDVFFRFGVEYAAMNEVPADFSSDEAVLKAFREFLAGEEIELTDEEYTQEEQYISQSVSERVVAAKFGLEEGARRAVERDLFVRKAIELLPDARSLRERARQVLSARRSTNGSGDEAALEAARSEVDRQERP